MSEANPTLPIEDPPPFVNDGSAASDKKNNAEKYGIEDSREAAVTSNNAEEVKNVCTEGEDANIVEADDTEGCNPRCDHVVSAEDVKMVDTQHEANIEAVNVKMVDTQREAKIEATDVKLVGIQDVKMVHTQHVATIEAEEDTCKDKEGKSEDNQHVKATAGEDIKMVEAKADDRNSEAQDRKEGACQKKIPTSIENKNMQMVDKEDMCQKDDKEGKNEYCQDASVANTDEMKIVEAKTDVRNADVQGDEKEEMEDKVEEKKNNANIEDDVVKTADKEVACHKEDEAENEDNHDANLAEGDKIMTVTAKSDAGSIEVDENEKKEENAKKTEEEKNNADIETEELIFLDKDDPCLNEDIQDAKESEARGLQSTGMSEVNPTPATQDPPPFLNGEPAASDKKNNAEKYGIEDSREAAVTSNNADEVKNDSENGTEVEDANIVEADNKEGASSGCDNVVSVQDVQMVDTQHEANIEAVDVKMVDTEHEAISEAADVKMVGTQDVKVVHTQHAATIEAEEDACKDKEGKNGDNQHAKATEGEDVKMVEAKADTRNSEAQDRKEDVCQKKIPTSEDKDMTMDTEDACRKEDKERKNENEDCQDAKVANADVKIVEGKTDVRKADVQGNEKKEEIEDKVEEKKNDAIIDDDGTETVNMEVACRKEDKGNNENNHDANVAQGDKIMMVTAKTNAGNTEVEENEKKEDNAKKTEEKNNADIETEELIFLDKDDACLKEHIKVNNEDIQDAKESEGEDVKIVEGNTDAIIPEAVEKTKKGEMEDNVEENKNDANIDAENVIKVENENACQAKDKERKTNGSQDANAAEGEGIVIVEEKIDAGNAGVKENGKKEEKEEQNAEKADGVNNKADGVKIVDKEYTCQKEDKERKNEDSHGAKAAEVEEIMVEEKSALVHAEAEVKENGKMEEDENTTDEKQNDNKEGSICVEKQDEDKMEPEEVHKQDGLTQEEKCRFDKHGMSDREETVKESQEVLKRGEKGNVDKQEMDDTEQNVKGKQEVLEEDEIVGSSKHKVAKDEQDGTTEKQEGQKLDVSVAAEKKEKQDVKLIAEEQDKSQDVKVAAEKKEEEEVNKNVAFENNAEIVIEKGVSEKYEEMELNGKTTVDKQKGKKDNQIDDAPKQEGQKNGTKRSNADMEEAENGSASKIEKDGGGEVEEAGESNNNMEENKDEAPKSKKARIVREEDKEKDKKQHVSKSRAPFSIDRPPRARKTVERLVEVEQSGSFVLKKGRRTPLKNIPSVSYRVSRKKPADLKFLHQILFGRFGKAADFKNHILEFSGFVWHESDEKHRAKAKEKLDKCSKDTLFDLCHLLAIPVSRINIKKEDIVTKLLDFIAEPRANDDSTLSDDQGSNSRKRKRGGSAAKDSEGTHKRSRKNLDDRHTSRKRQHKYSELESDEEGAEEEHVAEHMKSDSEENKDDGGEADDEQEDSYDSRKLKASEKFMEGKAAKRKAITGNVPKTAPEATLSKCTGRVSSSSKSSKDKQSFAEDPNSRKSKPITPKLTASSQKETYQRRSSGKGLATSKGKPAEREKALPSMDELQNTIVEILKKVNFNTATFSDVLKMLDGHYKMDLSSRKEAIKSMVFDELTKLAEADKD